MWMRIQYAGPLVYVWVSEFWVDYTLAGIGNGLGIDFEKINFHHFGWGSSMLVPLLASQWLEIWLGYTPAGTDSGFGIDFEIFFFMNVDEDPACWIPCLRVSEWVLGWLYPYWYRQWIWNRFWKNKFPSLWVRIQHVGPLAHFTMSCDLAWLYPCRYQQWGWIRFWNCFFHECGWGSIMLGPLFTCEWVNFGFVIPLPVPVVGLG
jgi:hypothetical protein